jgi:gamma-glutamyltranspeptidase/glutathione hydrolase
LLGAGGNAFDAVVAAGFASAVAEPALTSLGGGGFLLARPASASARLFDFFVDTPGRGRARGALEPALLPVTVRFPGSEQVFHVGPGSVAVPGNLLGLLHVHERLGRVPVADVLAPALRLARDGLELNASQAYFLELLRPIKTLAAPGRALFCPGGRFLAEGECFRNPELAAFLAALPGAAQDFYRGDLARAVERDMDAGEGLLTLRDLEQYRVQEREPLRASYRGFELISNPPPAFGGSLLALGLRLLEPHTLDASEYGSARHLALLVAVMQEAELHRGSACARPDALASADWQASEQRVRLASGGTTHVSVCDAEGNAASMTTSNGEGSGYFVPGTGIMLNNMMGEDDLHPEGFHASPPGQRVSSMMAPSLLMEGERLALVFGSGGSKRIKTALLQCVSGAVDFAMDAERLVEAPRVHWDGERAHVEPGFSAAALAALRERWPTNEWTVRDVYFGGVNAVSPEGGAGGDPRRGGAARVLS